jgi:hypothetical protein
MIADDWTAGETEEIIDSCCSMKGCWSTSVPIRVTNDGVLGTGVRRVFPNPMSEEWDGDCMGSSALRFLD